MLNNITFTLENQCRKNVLNSVYKDCPYFPCHQIDVNDFSCIFCYCPFYCENNEEKVCININGSGEWYSVVKDGEKIKVWDCSNCIYPHKIENAIQILLSFYSKSVNE